MKQFCYLFDCKQVINCPTRITNCTSSILDLIITSDNDKLSQSGVLNVGVSDHLITYCTRKLNRVKLNSHNTVNIRSLKNYSSELFTDKLKNINWYNVIDIDDVNMAWDKFKELFTSVIDEIAPKKQVRIKNHTEPWMTDEILRCIRERDKSLYEFRKHKFESSYKEFKCKQYCVQKQVKKAKSNYFKSQCEENVNNSKALWQSLKNLGLPSKKAQSSSNIGLCIDDEICFDNFKVAQKFNSFFTNIAAELVAKLPPRLNIYNLEFVRNFYKKQSVEENSYGLTSISEENVCKLLHSMNSKKATGLDNIAARFVKDGANVIAAPVTHIINLSIHHSVVPNDFKSA